MSESRHAFPHRAYLEWLVESAQVMRDANRALPVDPKTTLEAMRGTLEHVDWMASRIDLLERTIAVEPTWSSITPEERSALKRVLDTIPQPSVLSDASTSAANPSNASGIREQAIGATESERKSALSQRGRAERRPLNPDRMTSDAILHKLRQRAAKLRDVANTMPKTTGANERIKAAEELGRIANEIEAEQAFAGEEPSA